MAIKLVPDEPTGKVLHLPGTVLKPDVVLHRTLSDIGRIASVVVIIRYEDNTMAVDYSLQQTDVLCSSVLLLQQRVTDVLVRGGGDE